MLLKTLAQIKGYFFWRWFLKNNNRLINIITLEEPIANEFSAQLEKVDANLTFEVSANKNQNGKRELIISADGIKRAFPAVEGLVSAAPTLKDWEVIAFRQPSEIIPSISMGNLSLNPDDIWFSFEPQGNKTALTLFIRLLNSKNQEQIEHLSYVLLDAILGEYAVEMKIGSIEFKPLPEDPVNHHLYPIRNIRKSIPVL